MKRFILGPALSLWNSLHPTVAATLGGLLCAAALRAAGLQDWGARLDFAAILFRWLLPFLLFAGALHIDVEGLRREGAFVALLSSGGVIVATLFVGWALHGALAALGRDVPLPACLLFGALISPTDPVAVLAIFRRAQAPRPLAIMVGAESLFNDGFAVVVFASVLNAVDGRGVHLPRAALLFLKQSGGGLLAGLLLGELAARVVDRIKALPLQLALTALLAFAGCRGVEALGVSGLLAVIVAGIRVGGRDLRLKAWWTMADGALNVAAFSLLGLSALKVPWTLDTALLGLFVAVPVVLAGRAVSVALAMGMARPGHVCERGTFLALTWGGLRGAIPLALALSLPDGPEKPLLLALTYVVGLFSLIVQGSTI